MSFADIEARSTEAVMRRLSNATATPAVGNPVPVIFDRAHLHALGIDISGTKPVAQCVSADIVDWVPHQTRVTINGVDYTVRDIEPDGTGMSLVILEVA